MHYICDTKRFLKSTRSKERMYSHHNNSIAMQRNLSSSGLEIHALVDLLLLDFVAGEADSSGFGSERGVD